MQTKKPKIQIILEEDVYKELNKLAEKEMRSISQMGGVIITQYINELKAKQERIAKKSHLEKSSISGTG